jgi:pyridoxine/pyridoxamine 5'-phosphate oxidase
MQAAFSHGADRWVLDFAIDKKVIFSDLPHRAVILLPENWQQLETQLRKTGRAIRLSEVERDYYSHYRELQEQDGTQEILIVINREGLISEAVGKIEKRFAEGF